jgi:anti-sigma factor RsiW
MSIPREVVFDLLPLYVAGEASPASRTLVEEYLRGDPALAARVRAWQAEGIVPDDAASAGPPPEAEMKAFVRTRRLLTLRTWLFGLAIALTAIALAVRISFPAGQAPTVRLVILEEPVTLGSVLLAGVACWIAYAALGARLRTRPPGSPK